jgi:hypothetical protein
VRKGEERMEKEAEDNITIEQKNIISAIASCFNSLKKTGILIKCNAGYKAAILTTFSEEFNLPIIQITSFGFCKNKILDYANKAVLFYVDADTTNDHGDFAQELCEISNLRRTSDGISLHEDTVIVYIYCLDYYIDIPFYDNWIKCDLST